MDFPEKIRPFHYSKQRINLPREGKQNNCIHFQRLRLLHYFIELFILTACLFSLSFSSAVTLKLIVTKFLHNRTKTNQLTGLLKRLCKAKKRRLAAVSILDGNGGL